MKNLFFKFGLPILRVTALLAAIFWASLTPLENWNLYYPNYTDYPKNPMQALKDIPIAHLQNVYFLTRDGVRLNGWFIPPSQKDKPTVLFAHGNGGNMGDRVAVIKLFSQRGYGFFAFDYRGYGQSQGHPSEQGLYQDITAARNYLAQSQHIPPRQQIALGGSLGSAVVIDAATHIPFRAVVAYSTLTSAPAVADHLRDSGKMASLKFLPLERLMRQTYDSLGKVAQIHAPLLIAHGDQDHMMPLSMPIALYNKATTPHKKLLIVSNAGHENVIFQGETLLFAELDQLLAETDGSPRQLTYQPH